MKFNCEIRNVLYETCKYTLGLLLALAAYAQLGPVMPVNIAAANPSAFCSGSTTACAVTVTSLNLSSTAAAIVQCSTTGGVPVAVTGYSTTGSNPITTLTPTYSSTASVTCTVNASGGAGAPGPAFAPTTFINGLPLTGATFPAVRCLPCGSGDTDLYTAPAGKRVLVMVGGGLNPTSGTINWYFEIKSGGSYYRLTSSAAVLTHANSLTSQARIILEAGESLSVHTDATGMNIQIDALQFDNSSPARTVKLLGPASGDNTLYTVATAKTASILSITGYTWNASSIVSFSADAGGTRTANVCAVAFGGATTCAANSVNEIGFLAVAPSTTGFAASAAGVSLNSGDFVVVNVDTGNAAQITWINVLEF